MALARRVGGVGLAGVAAGVWLAAGAGACAQSLNIDWGAPFGTPGNGFAAAGRAGVWNTLGPLAGPQALVGLDGAPVGGTVELTPIGVGSLGFDHPGTTGDVEALMDDAVGGLAEIVGTAAFSGLRIGRYTVHVYAWAPGSPLNRARVWLNDDFENASELGGEWPGVLTEGVTHATFRIDLAHGRLRVNAVGAIAFSDWWLNGIQLERAGFYCYADCDPTPVPGVLDIFDFLCFQNRFAAGDPYACDCDMSGGQGVCDIFDFLCFQNAFAAGCT